MSSEHGGTTGKETRGRLSASVNGQCVPVKTYAIALAAQRPTAPIARITVTVDASGLPSTGGPPLENGSGITWTLYLAIGGAMLLAAASVVFATSRRTVR